MKETYFFSHDYNARTDIKIKNLIRKHGMLGYGIYWSIVEDLYNNANAMQTNYDSIAYDLRIDEDVAKSIINDFNLFVINDGLFGSLSVQSRLDKRAEKSKRATDSANIRWGNNANAMQTQSDSNALKERKGKENKGKESKQEEKEKTFSGDVIKSYEICLTFFPEHLHPKKESQINNWIDTIKKLNEIEKLPFSFIEDLVKKARNDNFWQKTFLSIPKLRKKNNEDIMYFIVFNEKFNGNTVNKKNKQIENIKANLENW